jgi:hypothetical protein
VRVYLQSQFFLISKVAQAAQRKVAPLTDRHTHTQTTLTKHTTSYYFPTRFSFSSLLQPSRPPPPPTTHTPGTPRPPATSALLSPLVSPPCQRTAPPFPPPPAPTLFRPFYRASPSPPPLSVDVLGRVHRPLALVSCPLFVD